MDSLSVANDCQQYFRIQDVLKTHISFNYHRCLFCNSWDAGVCDKSRCVELNWVCLIT